MNIIEDFIALFFPSYCVNCKKSLYSQERLVCTHCLTNVAKTNSHEEVHNFVERKFHGRIHLQNVWAYLYFHQGGIAQNLLHELKYNNMSELGVELGKRYAVDLLDHIAANHIEYIVPVPLYKRKQKKRGYNQSEKIAEGISLVTELPLLNALERSANTATQTAKSRIHRWQNVSNIFRLVDSTIKDKNVLLVDDVITTGATVESCAQVLQNAGCKITVVALASAK